MVGFGVFMIVGVPLTLLGWEWGAASALAWIRLVFSVLLIAAGICVLRKRAYWWAVSAAIGMTVVGASYAALVSQDLFFRRFDTASTLFYALLAARAWAISAVPGILALVFLVKRKAEFRPSQGV